MAPPEPEKENDIDNPDFTTKTQSDQEKLIWIQLRREIGSTAVQGEGMRDKLLRKTRENPFVPIGCLATAGVLTYGLWCMKSGDTRRSQLMMRLRIGAQGLTIGALLLGIVYSSFKPS